MKLRLLLQGWIFFGTINVVETRVQRLLDNAQWQNNPIRFLIVDLSLVLGVDISSCEALVRLQRLLASKSVMLIFCGMAEGSSVWRSLQNVDIFGESNVQVFDTIEQAVECACPWDCDADLFAHVNRDRERLHPRLVRVARVPKHSHHGQTHL